MAEVGRIEIHRSRRILAQLLLCIRTIILLPRIALVAVEQTTLRAVGVDPHGPFVIIVTRGISPEGAIA